MKIVVPDLVSNSYFPAAAAHALCLFADEGLDMAFELLFPVDRAYEAMRDGEVDFVAGSAHSALAAFPDWKGVKLLCAQSQGMYWFLVMGADRGAARGDVSAVKGARIGAAPWVDYGLKALLADAGIDLARDKVEIAPVPGATGAGVSFGVTAAKALEQGLIDGFWANGMGAEVAVRNGIGTMVLDVRRGDGPKSAFGFTCPAIATTDKLLAEAPEAAAAVRRAIVRAQKALIEDVSLATEVGRKLFPPEEAGLIADIVARDLPFYDPGLSPEFIASMNRFAMRLGLLSKDVPYDDVVASNGPI